MMDNFDTEMTTIASTEKPKTREGRIKHAELQIKFDRLLEYVQGKKLAWVYRAEGEHVENAKRSGGNEELVGSWYAPSYQKALDYQRERTEAGIEDVKVFKVAIPEELLEQREWIDKGMGQINLINPDFIDQMINEEPITPPTISDYMLQIRWVQELLSSGSIEY